MKNILFIFAIILQFVLMNSCSTEDIISFDDVDPNLEDVSNKFKPKTVEFFFIESYDINGNISDYFWNNKVVRIDRYQLASDLRNDYAGRIAPDYICGDAFASDHY